MFLVARPLLGIAFSFTLLVALAKAQAPIPIMTVQDLQNIQNNLAGNYVVMNNIDATATAMWNGGKGFLPIGSASAPFTGTLNGNEYTISGLFIYSSLTNVGLFGSAGSAAVIENVSLTGVNVTGLAGGGETGATGALVGHLDGQVISCTIAGTVTGTSDGNIAGGLVGSSTGSVTKSSANITVSAPGVQALVGGLVGLNIGSITSSTATGSVTNTTYGGNEGGLLVITSHRDPSSVLRQT